MTERTFTTRTAVRERVPLLIGLMGPSGSGKTYSALRLATGMQRVSGGSIHMIDTEARRSLHYADTFKFEHTEFLSPFSPLDYMAAIDHGVSQEAGIVIVDSMSHEHEGPGGVLEWHERELDRMAGQDFGKRNRMTFAAWAKPKGARRRLINTILQIGVNAIFCFRAKPKLKIQKGKDPLELGWMPIAGDEFLYEMTLNCLLYPHSEGVPTWKTEQPGERQMLKLPEQFRSTFETAAPLSEDIGQVLAEWACGDVKMLGDGDLADVLSAIDAADVPESLRAVASEHSRRPWSPQQRARIKQTIDLAQNKHLDAAQKRLEARRKDGDKPEVDPQTGEVIPSSVGREAQQGKLG